MLARTSTIRHKNSGVSLRTPLLVPSFSSKGFSYSKSTGKSEIGDIAQTASEFITDACLFSAYDFFYEHLPPPDEILCRPDLIIVDSGGYEVSQDKDYSSVIDPMPAPEPWSRKLHGSILANWPKEMPAVFVSYDTPDERKPLLDQVNDAQSLFSEHPAQLNLFLLKPETQTQNLLDATIRVAVANIDKLRFFDIIGVTEKELGNSFLVRMKRIAQLRKALDEASIVAPIHVFGALDPVSVSLYFLAGAEVFDGLTWLRYGYRDNVAMYTHNVGALFYGIHVSNNHVKLRAMTKNIYELQDLEHRMREFLKRNDYSKFDPHKKAIRDAVDRFETQI